jgi:hypothetical protein
MPTQFAETVTPVLPLAPEVHPEPPSYRRIQVREHMWRLAEAKVLTPTQEIARQGPISVGRLTPRVCRVRFRTRRLNRRSAWGAMRLWRPSLARLKPRNDRSAGRATALLAALTVSRSLRVRKRATLAITRSPAWRLRT